MKQKHILTVAALAAILATSCEKKSPDLNGKIAELERKANEAVERQKDLELQIETQKLAAERDAIERERMQIEDARIALEQQKGAVADAEAERIRQREIVLANREGKVEQLQNSLQQKESDLSNRSQQLSDKEQEIAGRGAMDFTDDNVQRTPVGDYGMFYDSLSSYGSWFESPTYGYVWQPIVVRDSSWRPYTRGRWVCTDSGWTWISEEPFGWATYHYGRWTLLRGRGWVWVPGSEWAPSWVSWRSSGTRIGWAPLPPETLAYRNNRWDSSVDVTFGIGALWFNFVETRNFSNPIYRHCLPYSQNNIYIDQTVNITNIYVQNRRVICGGPVYRDVCRQIGRPVPYYRLDMDHRGRPGRDSMSMQPRFDGDRLRVSAPNMDVAWNDGLKPNHVKGRLDQETVERPQPLNPEVSEQFRKSRDERRRNADESINELGGRERFNTQRLERLEQNRRQADQEAKLIALKKETEKQPVTGNAQIPSEDIGKGKRNTNGQVSQIPLPEQERTKPADNSRELRKQREELAAQQEELRKQKPAARPGDSPNITSPAVVPQAPADNTRELRKQREELAAQQEELRKQKPATRPGDSPNITPPAVVPQAPADNSRELRRQREELAAQQEQARLQQQERAAREQQARQQQLQETTRGQQQQEAQENARRQQQDEAQKQQLETQQQARQQQLENARRVQQDEARKQQLEAQQQARQQQMEEARREQQREAQQQQQQARQQQMEESRREQQREAQQQQQQARQQQMEESRREQQREAQQQQQQDSSDSDKRRGR
ncbi:MAG: hypothetical protein H8M99_13210 [Gloeobacteraceae cyanobacterium ES-bin-144]|nr:hypothetical protein [Verrucomicrobiales bacterium]